MDFVTACSNLRASNYDIPNADRHKVWRCANKHESWSQIANEYLKWRIYDFHPCCYSFDWNSSNAYPCLIFVQLASIILNKAFKYDDKNECFWMWCAFSVAPKMDQVSLTIGTNSMHFCTPKQWNESLI